ncbi:hypothetical protein ECB94_21300 [Vibrio mediterranei]|uniref:Uncharacterized protein n=1 Tax=Vibrio mediterranei TaxID=689 RepID=A0A3G4VIM3_9VIBR|nr:hypothetical protein ECB94_21300 [Vibrio mediterranei]
MNKTSLSLTFKWYSKSFDFLWFLLNQAEINKSESQITVGFLSVRGAFVFRFKWSERFVFQF